MAMKGNVHISIWASFSLSTSSSEYPGRGIQPIFSEVYVEREKDAHILISSLMYIS